MQSRCESPPTTHELFPGVKPSGGAGASGLRRSAHGCGGSASVLSVSHICRSTCSKPVLVDWSSLHFFDTMCGTPRIFTTYGIMSALDSTAAERLQSQRTSRSQSAAPRSGGRSGREAVGLLAVTPLLCYSPGADGPAEGPPVRPACCASASPEKRPVTTSSGSSRKRAYTREA